VVVLTGGGALLNGMTETAEQVFDAPVRVGFPKRDDSVVWSRMFRVLHGPQRRDCAPGSARAGDGNARRQAGEPLQASSRILLQDFATLQ